MSTTLLDGTPEELRASALASIEKARGIAAKAEAEGRDFTDTERNEVTALFDDAKGLKAKADTADGDDAIRKAVDELGGGLAAGAVPSTSPIVGAAGARKTMGERFTEDETIKAWLKTVAPQGRIAEKARVESPPIQLGGLKDIVSGGSATGAGALVFPDFLGLTDEGIYRRPLNVRGLLTSGTTGSDTVEFTRETTAITNNADAVPEASGSSAGTGSGDVAGTKPESHYELERVTEHVRTIAHWLPATKRALTDAAQIRTLIDNFLRYGLEERLEENIVNGDGTGESFEGVLNTSGTQALTAAEVDAADETAAGALAAIVALRMAKRKVRIGGRAMATAHLLHPNDNEKIDLARDGFGQFYFGGPGANGISTAWGLPRVESESVPEGTAITAAWDRGVLWDREQATIAVSDSHADFFVRNLVAILGELRAAFGIMRPPAFVVIELSDIFAITV